MKKDHNPNKKQQAAFDRVVRAIESAKKTGLVFYAKQWNLTAYTQQADDYIESTDFRIMMHGDGATVPFLDSMCLADSGADDYPRYKTVEDEKKFNKYSDLND